MLIYINCQLVQVSVMQL